MVASRDIRVAPIARKRCSVRNAQHSSIAAIGMVLIVARENVSTPNEILESSGETVYELGEIKNGAGGVVLAEQDLVPDRRSDQR